MLLCGVDGFHYSLMFVVGCVSRVVVWLFVVCGLSLRIACCCLVVWMCVVCRCMLLVVCLLSFMVVFGHCGCLVFVVYWLVFVLVCCCLASIVRFFLCVCCCLLFGSYCLLLVGE